MERELDLREAIREALDEELERDETVIIFGEDVAAAGGVFQVTRGLVERHGGKRIFDTPISELALVSAGFGAATSGLRPIVEIMFGDFLGLAMDSIVNQAAKWWFLSNETVAIPLVIRTTVGAGARFGAIHSQIPIPWFHAIPGLKILAPANPHDGKHLLKAAIRDNNPVLFMEHKRLYASKGIVGEEDMGMEKARIVRSGADLTLVTALASVRECVGAAEDLAKHGVEAEVIDLRSLRPIDIETVLRSVKKTGRLGVVEEGPRTGGWSGEVLAEVAERGLGDVDDVWRLTGPDIPLPFSPPLEDVVLPSATRITKAVLARLKV